MGKTENILENLPSFLNSDNNSNNYKILNITGIELDDLEITKKGLLENIHLSTAKGKYLDDIGKLFLLNRLTNESDDSFRNRIKAYWQGAIGGGTEKGLKNMLMLLLGVDESAITITEINTLKININVVITQNIENLNKVKEILFKSKAAGVFIIMTFDFDLEEKIAVFEHYKLIDTTNLFVIAESEIESEDLLG